MVWKILRPHYWMLDRTVRATNRLVVIGLILLVLYAGDWIFKNLLADNLALLNSDQAAATIATILPMAFFILLLFALLGIGDVLYQLYLAGDLEILMVAPLPYRTIFLVKLLQCSRATLIPALVFGAFLIAFGAARSLPVGYYLLILLLTVAAIALVTALIMILVMLLARLLPAGKVRSWMPAAILLATIVLMLLQQLVTQRWLSQDHLVNFLNTALLDLRRLGLFTAGFVALAGVGALIAYQVFATAFHEGWNRFRVVPSWRKPGTPPAQRPGGLYRLLRPVSAPLRAIIVKEWLELRRNPRGLIALIQPFILVLFILLPFLFIGNNTGSFTPILFWFLLFVIMITLSTSPLGTALIVVAQEGPNMALLRTRPVSMSAVLKGKWWANWTPNALSWFLVLFLTGSWLRFPFWQTVVLVGIALWGLTGASLMTQAIAGWKVDFSVADLRKRSTSAMNYLIMGLNLAFVLITAALFIWIMVRLLPESDAVQAIAALSGFNTIGWLFSPALWPPLILGLGQVAFWIATIILWNTAVRRLEAWEEV
jgi:hypothetical protein